MVSSRGMSHEEFEKMQKLQLIHDPHMIYDMTDDDRIERGRPVLTSAVTLQCDNFNAFVTIVPLIFLCQTLDFSNIK